MPEIYTNLPPKDSNTLDKTIEKLTTTSYQTCLLYTSDAADE